MMRELGLKPSTLALAQHYGDAVDGWVIDRRDADQRDAIGYLGKRVLVADTLMTGGAGGAALARRVVSFVRSN